MVVKHSNEYYLIANKNLSTKSVPTDDLLINDHIRDISLLKKDIDDDIFSLRNSNKKIMEQIDVLESDKYRLLTKINDNYDKHAGSFGMYHDSQDLYITKLLENYLLFIFICIIIYKIYKQ